MKREDAVKYGLDYYDGDPCAVDPSHGGERYPDDGSCVICADAAEKVQTKVEHTKAAAEPDASEGHRAAVFMPISPPPQVREALRMLALPTASGLGAIVFAEAARRCDAGTDTPIPTVNARTGATLALEDPRNAAYDAMFRVFAERLWSFEPPDAAAQAFRFLGGLLINCPRHTATLISAMSEAAGENRLTDAECVELGRLLPIWVEHWVEGLRGTSHNPPC